MKTKYIWIILWLGVIISFYFVISTAIDGYCIWGNNKDYEVTGQFGDFIGGVVGTLFSLAGTLFVYMTFKEQIKFNNEQKNFNTKQIEFNNFQQIEKEKDRMWEMIKHITNLSDNFIFHINTVEIKGLENIKKLSGQSIKQDEFSEIYYYVSGLTELCLLSYRTNKESNYSPEEKESFKRIIWRYSKNTASFWNICIKKGANKDSDISISHFSNVQTMLDIKQKEIENYIVSLRKLYNQLIFN